MSALYSSVFYYQISSLMPIYLRLVQGEGRKAGFLANVCLSKQSNHIAGAFKMDAKKCSNRIDGPLALAEFREDDDINPL